MKNLKDFNSYIKDFKQITLDEAKEKIESAEALPDNEKSKIYQEVFEGTLYLVLRMLKNEKFEMIKSSYFDMDDIISEAMNIWYEVIKSGELLNYNSYLSFEASSFINRISSNLIGTDNQISENFGLSQITISKLLYLYIEYRNNHIFNEEEYLKIVEESQIFGNYDRRYGVSISDMLHN